MTKKKKPAKGTTGTQKKPAKKERAGTSALPGAGVITIAEGNDISVVPEVITVNPGSDLTFLVVNQDIDDHDIWIDPAEVINKGSGKKQDPFDGDIGRKHVPAGKLKSMQLKIKAKFSEPKLTFKYTVTSFNKNGTSSSLDPDLDVVDPMATSHA